MNKIFITIIFFNLYICPVSARDATYFVDVVNGNDNNNGRNITSAWRTLDKLNTITFEPGDRINLKRGQVLEGFLVLKGSGTREKPIIVNSFGIGRKPVINSANHEYAIKLSDVQYWEIEGIETSGGEKAGIFICCTKDDLVLNHFRIIDCYVHNVGDDSTYDWKYNALVGGIVIVNGIIEKGKETMLFNSVINDAIIDGCTVRYIKRWNCISITSGKSNGTKGNGNYIRNCIAQYSVADGIRMTGVQNSFIEYCTMYKNGAWPMSPNRDWGGLGAWFFESDNCAIQYCEASYIDNWHEDGGAFDIDYRQTNSTIQYCYGHDCHGYGASVFGADSSFPTANSVVKNNIFSNNARDSAYAYQGDIFVFTWDKGLLDGVKIYNNTSFWNPAADAPALKWDADFTGTNPNLFKNNIIYSHNSWLVFAKNNSFQCDSNIYWATNKKPAWNFANNWYYSLADWQRGTGQDFNSKYADPLSDSSIYNSIVDPLIADKKTRPENNTAIHNQTANIVRIGSKAPDFELQSSTKGKIRLSDLKGKTVLLSFINSHRSSKADVFQSTRNQITFLKSMKAEYGERGLIIILVDGTRAVNQSESTGTMINFTYDNELVDIPLLREQKSKDVAGKYGIVNLPTTFLLSKNGIVIRRWDNVALPAQLAFAIEGETGLIHFR